MRSSEERGSHKRLHNTGKIFTLSAGKIVKLISQVYRVLLGQVRDVGFFSISIWAMASWQNSEDSLP